MLLTITHPPAAASHPVSATHHPATDLGYLLVKHPDRTHRFEIEPVGDADPEVGAPTQLAVFRR